MEEIDLVEMFGPRECEKQLPVNEVTEEYTFGQFIKLRYGSEDPRPIASFIPPGIGRDFIELAGFGPLNRAVSIKGVLSGKPEPLPSSDTMAGVARVMVRDLDELVADGSIKLKGKKTPVTLDAAKLRRLLAGLPVETIAGSKEKLQTRVLLVPEAERIGVADAPASRQYVVRDLAAFLANPVVPGVGGLPYAVPLASSMVKQLRIDGSAVVGNGDKQVILTTDVSASSNSLNAVTQKITDGRSNITNFRDSIADADDKLGDGTNPTARIQRQSGDAFTVGLYLPWKQTWRLKGYSRGVLLHSLTLAPQEETTIELFTWDRRKRSLEQSSSFESDQSIEQSDTTKDVIDVVRELASSNEFKIEGHAKVNVKYAAVEAEVGVRGDYTSKLNNTARRSTNHLHESTQKAAARVRVNRQTKISESSETGREERVTRKVRNANMCRTLTLDYFEVLSHYIVTTAFNQDDAQVCLFVPFPLGLRNYQFTDRDLRIHERALRTALINPELAPGFEAARTLYARDWAMIHVCDAPLCPADNNDGGDGASGTATANRVALEEAVKRVLISSKTLSNASVWDFIDKIATTRSDPSPAQALAVQRWGFRELLTLHHGSAWETLNQLALAGTTREVYTPLGKPQSETIPPIETGIQIAMLEQLIDSTPPATLQTIDIGQPNEELRTALRYAMAVLVENNFQRDIGILIAAFNAAERFQCLDPDDAGLVSALINFQSQLTSYKKATNDLFGNNADVIQLRQAQRQVRLDAEADQVRSAFSLGDLASAAERVDALVKHLNLHQSHYRFALMQALPIGDQMQDLAMLGIPTDLVEPRILGMVNAGSGGLDLLAVPVNTAIDPDWKKVRDIFIEKNEELVKLTASREVRMPTPGTSIEARLGACDACEEFIMKSRSIELDQRRAQVRAQQAAARQAELEADRLDERVKKGELDDPSPEANALHVTIDKPVTP